MVDATKRGTETGLLKGRLLQTGCFIDNAFLDKYIELIDCNATTRKEKLKTQEHHILQKKYFIENSIAVDNSTENVVNLYYADHCMAHYYLCFCTVGYLRLANINTVLGMLGFSSRRDLFRLSEKSINDMMPRLNEVYTENQILMKNRMTGHSVSPKSREKMSVAHKGKPGHKKTDEEKRKISVANKGKKRSAESREKMRGNHPDFVGTNNPAYGRHWYHNGADMVFLKDGDTPPEGFVRGRVPMSEEEKQKRSFSNIGKHGHSAGRRWYNNGKVEVMAVDPPASFSRGRLPHKRSKSKTS